MKIFLKLILSIGFPNNLSLDLDESIFLNYCNLAFDALGNEPVFLVDDSDVTKPLGNKFEDLGIVRDGF